LRREYSFDELRVTHAQNIVLPHVRKADLYTMWQKLDASGPGDANLDLISDIIACPGLDYCSLANARSIPVAQKIAQRFADPASPARPGRTEAQDFGLHQRLRPSPRRPHRHSRRRPQGHRELPAARSAEARAPIRLARQDHRPRLRRRRHRRRDRAATDVYLALREGDERFLDTYRRVGMEPFKEAIYGGRDVQFRFRDDEPVADPARDGRCVSATRPTPPPSGLSRATMRAILLPHLDRIAGRGQLSPPFGDGRGYSSARILREAGYTGELRAVGDVTRRPASTDAPLRV
jgi:hypothetical protein